MTSENVNEAESQARPFTCADVRVWYRVTVAFELWQRRCAIAALTLWTGPVPSRSPPTALERTRAQPRQAAHR
ncbi:hypothetical protein ACFYRJ_42280, partial [Streptomyces sp. NPDC005531]|uniref:hypothetical protein n=1 Tax=Streptomyces sp. NPDC005531 TaxID=3364722 RepID=UPI0036CEA7D6